MQIFWGFFVLWSSSLPKIIRMFRALRLAEKNECIIGIYCVLNSVCPTTLRIWGFLSSRVFALLWTPVVVNRISLARSWGHSMLFFCQWGRFSTCLRHGFGHLGLHLFAGFRGNFLANLSLSLMRAFGRFLRKFLENVCRRCFVGFFLGVGNFLWKKVPPDAKRKLGPLSGNLGPLSRNWAI